MSHSLCIQTIHTGNFKKFFTGNWKEKCRNHDHGIHRHDRNNVHSGCTIVGLPTACDHGQGTTNHNKPQCAYKPSSSQSENTQQTYITKSFGFQFICNPSKKGL
jgi:hypothetical protein